MTDYYLWSNTDSQIAAPGTASPPDTDNWVNPAAVVLAPRIPTSSILGWDEQGEMPLLQAVDDGGWVPYFTQGATGLSIPDGSAWADEGLPTPPTVTPQEDWDVVRLLGLPLAVPPPVRQEPWRWHSEEREAAITAIFPSDDSILPLMRVITPPLQSPLDRIWSFEQSDWWGGGTGTGGDVIQLQTLQTTGSMAIP